MGKLFSFRYALLISILLLSISSYGFVKAYFPTQNKSDNPTIQQSQDTITESSLITIPPLLHGDKVINVLGTNISLGESTEGIINKLGSPSRIAKTEMDFSYYIYNNNYSKLLFIAIGDNQVVGFYTDSIDFDYLGITSGCSLDEVNRILEMDYDMNSVLTHTTDTYTIYILLDEIGTQGVTGIFLLGADVNEAEYTSEVIRDVELMVYDLTNSIRRRNNIPLLSWSSSAAKASRKHSIDMAENRFFDHYGSYNKSPGDRLKEEGIHYQSIGENIIAGYGTAIFSSHAWFNSPEHRENILNKDYRSLGVGFTYQEDSIYKTYITQKFFR